MLYFEKNRVTGLTLQRRIRCR